MTAELRTWARALTVLAAAWVIIRIGDRLHDAARMRRARRSLHRSLVDAYATRRQYGTTLKFDEAIRAGEDTWLMFQPTTNEGTLTE